MPKYHANLSFESAPAGGWSGWGWEEAWDFEAANDEAALAAAEDHARDYFGDDDPEGAIKAYIVVRDMNMNEDVGDLEVGENVLGLDGSSGAINRDDPYLVVTKEKSQS